jgi:hypothetical protein
MPRPGTGGSGGVPGAKRGLPLLSNVSGITSKWRGRMNVCSDYEDLFKILNAKKIKYLVVGAYAVIYYTQPRYTKDIDVWIIPDLNDTERIYEALKAFGTPLKDLDSQSFKDKDMIFQIGVAPVRIDIMLDISGVSFHRAWRNKKRVYYGKTPIYILGRKDLMAVKGKSGRPQDRIDLDRLRKAE